MWISNFLFLFLFFSSYFALEISIVQRWNGFVNDRYRIFMLPMVEFLSVVIHPINQIHACMHACLHTAPRETTKDQHWWNSYEPFFQFFFSGCFCFRCCFGIFTANELSWAELNWAESAICADFSKLNSFTTKNELKNDAKSNKHRTYHIRILNSEFYLCAAVYSLFFVPKKAQQQ